MHASTLAASPPDDDSHALELRYLPVDDAALLRDARTLAVVRFGAGSRPEDAAAGRDANDWDGIIQVPLQVVGAASCEHWRVAGPVERGRDGAVRFARSAGLQLSVIEVDERDGDIRSAARDAYAGLGRFLAAGRHPHALRIWNTIAAITAGDGDAERYRQFCIGRAEGMGDAFGPFPAATAVGSLEPPGRLQVYVLSASEAGVPLENPRQLSAWRYPRQYGPKAPSFARAMLAAGEGVPLLVSGTASIVGHASAHADSVDSQLAETCANLEHLLASARERRPALPAQFGARSTFKVYLRDPANAVTVRARLQQRFPGASLLLLHAEVCRRELLVEIDGFHGP